VVERVETVAMKDKKLTINWISPRTGLSGGVKSNRLIAEGMVRRGHRVNIAYVDLPPQMPPIWRIRTFFRYWINRYKNRRQAHHLEKSTANLIPVKRRPIIEADVPDADVTIATWWETAHWIKDWSERKGKKAYFIRHYELHGGDTESVKETYRLPYKKLVIANWLKKIMLEDYGDKNSVLIPNGVDWNQFNFQTRSKQPIPTVGMLYGIVEWKGAETAFNAIRIVQKTIPELKVICFGSHELKPEHRPPENFEYFFRPPQDLIPELYKRTDCWLLPSTLEGFGMPGIEAAACGCPVVTTRCGGPEDYIKDGYNGFLVNVGDAQDMAKKIIRVLSMDEALWNKMSSNSASYAKSFDWDISAEILESTLLDEIADRRE
jgi:glycosyltransferase involved in cell wall biosynthesis